MPDLQREFRLVRRLAKLAITLAGLSLSVAPMSGCRSTRPEVQRMIRAAEMRGVVGALYCSLDRFPQNDRRHASRLDFSLLILNFNNDGCIDAELLNYAKQKFVFAPMTFSDAAVESERQNLLTLVEHPDERLSDSIAMFCYADGRVISRNVADDEYRVWFRGFSSGESPDGLPGDLISNRHH